MVQVRHSSLEAPLCFNQKIIIIKDTFRGFRTQCFILTTEQFLDDIENQHY